MTETDVWTIGLVVAVTAVDVWLLVRKKKTFSIRWREYAYELSFSATAWGIVGGHIWSGNAFVQKALPLWLSIGVMVAAVIVVAGLHHELRKTWRPPRWWNLVYVVYGLWLGAFFWPV